MDRGAWRATVHGVARVGYDLATKPTMNVYHKGMMARSNSKSCLLTLLLPPENASQMHNPFWAYLYHLRQHLTSLPQESPKFR